jgi:hypothetical protein
MSEVLNVSGEVSVSELNASEPLMRYRKLGSLHRKQRSVTRCEKSAANINWFWLHDVRYREGKTLTQAKQWNRRT